MKILSIDNIKPGMINGRTIMGFSNQNFLTAGTPLTKEYIARLKELGIISLYIIDEHTEDIAVDDVVCEQTRMEAGQLTKDIMEKTRLGKGVDSRKVKQIINLIIEDLLGNRELLIKLVDIRSLNDYTYFHGVNVSILSGIVGIKLGYSNAKLQELMVGALFHDLGKTLLAEQVLQAHGDITLMRQHPQVGYEIMQKNKSFSILAAHVAFQHHERVDGQGYPRSLTEDEIHPYAKIVAIANTYDHLTTDSFGKPRIPPYQAVEYLMVNAGYSFDPDMVNAFLQCLALYPEGTVVKLNTGDTAIIVKSYYGFPTRPRIKITADKQGKKLPVPETIELYKTPTYFIAEVLS